MIGGGPQGSQTGEESYTISSDDNVPEKDRYKYCDDLHMLELVMIDEILVEYDVIKHVASHVGIGQKFLAPKQC